MPSRPRVGRSASLKVCAAEILSLCANHWILEGKTGCSTAACPHHHASHGPPPPRIAGEDNAAGRFLPRLRGRGTARKGGGGGAALSSPLLATALTTAAKRPPSNTSQPASARISSPFHRPKRREARGKSLSPRPQARRPPPGRGG